MEFYLLLKEGCHLREGKLFNFSFCRFLFSGIVYRHLVVCRLVRAFTVTLCEKRYFVNMWTEAMAKEICCCPVRFWSYYILVVVSNRCS